MNRARIEEWGTNLSKLKRFSENPWFYPAALLLIGLLTYGYVLKSLGYYWDDWEVVFLLNTRNLPLLYGYFAFDRPFAWPYQAMYALFGLNPIAWHLVTLLLRWAGTFLLYLTLKQLWPRYDSYLRWLGVLLLVYPGYFQQSISGAYNRHFTSFFLFALSVYLVVLAVRHPRRAWFLFPLSWIIAFVQVFTIEYFVGLELIVPVVLWILLAQAEEGIASSGRTPSSQRRVDVGTLRRTVLLSLPYLVILGFYFWWRLVVFPASLAKLNYAGDFKMLEDFKASFMGGALSVFTRAFFDLIYSTFQVWVTGLTSQEGFTFQSKAVWFAFGVGIIVAVLFAFFNGSDPEVETDGHPERYQSPLSVFLFGLWAFLASSLPIWLTNKQLSGSGRWDDRFALAMMPGAVIMTLAGILWLIRASQRKLLLGLMLVFSVATQVLIVNKYRLDWDEQRNYYWQLAWRAPALEPGTAIFSLEQPSISIPGYDASFALNILFKGQILNGSTPYWFFTNNRFLNFDFTPGKAISYSDRNLKFSGNTSQAISIVHQGADRCLQVLDAPYANEPFYTTNQEQLVSVSNVSRIRTDSAEPPDANVFGPEPPHQWCYYFEKADLARQRQDWKTVLLLEKQAREQGFTPKFGPEYLPFIEAYAHTGNWQKAFDSSLAAQAVITEMEPLLCSTWEDLGKLPTADVDITNQAMQVFACPAP